VAVSAAGLTLTGFLFFLFFSSNEPPDAAGIAFVVIAYGTVAATSVTIGVAGVSQAVHGRWNRLSRWVFDWMST
jgi:hypothetical protein